MIAWMQRKISRIRLKISALSNLLPAGAWLLMLLAAQTVFISGCCTPALWEEAAFDHCHHPANPPNLQLFYSNERKDILVKYDESSDTDKSSRLRCYWLEPNTMRVNKERKPHFVSAKEGANLLPIRILGTLTHDPPPAQSELFAVARSSD